MTWPRCAGFALALVVLGVIGIGTLAAGDGEDDAASPGPPTSTTVDVVAMTSRPTATTTQLTAPASTVASTITATPTTTTTTTTTIVPVVTYAADIGVLAPVAVAVPVRVTLPALDVDGVVVPTGVDELGELDVPPDARTLVWYRFGPTPGDAGSAVIAGHLNWRGVEGIFADLADLPVGAPFTVDYDDGSQRAFLVRAVELVDKPAVSVNGVFARDGESVVRLVTCGGEFDSSTRHYRSNVIVTAVLA